MRWKISPHGHDPRQIDLLAIAALMALAICAFVYVERSPEPPVTTSFTVPSQNVRW
jgi:hypothetical protein